MNLCDPPRGTEAVMGTVREAEGLFEDASEQVRALCPSRETDLQKHSFISSLFCHLLRKYIFNNYL